MNLRKQAVKGVVWSGIQRLGTQVISFVVFSLLARLLGPEAFGLVALADVFLAFMRVFTEQGFSQAIVQRQELEPEHLDTAFWINLTISGLLTAIGMTGAPLIASWFNQPEIAPIIRWLSLGFILSAFNSIQQAIFTRRLSFKALAARSLVAQLVAGVVGVVMAFLGFGVWSLVGQRLVNQFVAILVLWWVSDWKPGLRVSKRHFQELFAFGVNILAFYILNFFNQRSDNFLIGYFLGPEALGYYAIAYRLLELSRELVTTTSQVALPAFSRLQSEPEKLRQGYYTATQLTCLIAFPVFLGLSALAPELIPAMFGNQWTPSIQVMQILMFVGIVHAIGGINGNVILAMGRSDWTLKVNIINAATNVTAFILAVQWGIVAVATVFVIRAYLIPLPIFLWMVRKLIRIDLRTYVSCLTGPLLGTLTMVAALLGAKYLLNDLIGLYGLLAVCLAIGSLVYVGAIRLISPALFRKVLDLVRSILPRKAES